MHNAFDEIECKIPQRGVFIHATLALPSAAKNAPCPLVAYVHGFAGSRHENGGATLIAQHLAQKGVASIRMDLAGCGESEETGVYATLSHMISDVEACFAYALANYPIDEARLGIIGNSMGGRVALEYINSGMRHVSAVLLTAPAARTSLAAGLLGGAEPFANAYATAKKDDYFAFTTIFGACMHLSPAWFEEMQSRNVYSAPSAYKGAMQVVFAADDEVIDADVAPECAAHYAAQLTELSGGGHTFGFYTGQQDVMQKLADIALHFFAQELLA